MNGFARPRLLASAPTEVIEYVRAIVGGRVLREEPASDGFTPSVASVVVADGIRQVFVKAGPKNDEGGRAVRTGAELSEVIIDLGPALIGWAERAGWYVAVYERLAGAAVVQWEANDIAELSALAATMRDRLSPSPIADTKPFADAFAPLLGTWRALVEPGHPQSGTVEHVRDRTLPYGLQAETLAGLESDWFEALREGSSLQHGDLRRDNILREPSGRLRLVDWTHRWTAPRWADWVRLVPDLAADGFDPQAAFEAIAGREANEHEVNVMLAGLAGRCWRDGHLAAVPGLPQLRPMQRLQGDMTLRWMAQRGLR
ncbi:Phosphotransferase enzyme family protein [Agreia bicolorata]|uniref:Phosphotransferase enzyme family protein n=1 Tax=Agreia bicolorata TaxID=110935 RepID=A0A1T4XYE0_9MICO|nr:phosphotransferase [Agreia bicolorata]KJC63891.1 hypothetical protein TZ00_12855 [Agreia bicolorata]SKA94065.1 Phosphotransferase enzyme family protein [Agreia bicolorata]